ncbi:holo-ACP synthase [Evansella clarkii]|jgi:holo-[acyl-carrier protein] synthase|uniref:holo-ACP synthase n=1 Tax=Evansella clarkii TaxID=79879 RepID=UPI000996B666|nr:holo-ACP synthase [Evansella clarkii]
MIIGTGLDIVEISRIKALYSRKPAFAKRILTEEEFRIFDSLPEKRKLEYLAGRFSGKEAYAKATGTGIGRELSFQDIRILNDKNGKPVIHTKSAGSEKAHISITHTATFAAAQVIIETL